MMQLNTISRWIPSRTSVRVATVAFVAAMAAACNQDVEPTTTRNLDRPSALAFICANISDTANVRAGEPLEACSPKEDADPNVSTAPTHELFGFVANSARGDVALFRPSLPTTEPLVDLDRTSPGFGFIPVGNLPSDMKSTSDGCRVVVANTGSCDLSVIDTDEVLNVAFAESSSGTPIARRILPRTARGLLRAKPHALVVRAATEPNTSQENACDTDRRYTAYVTFPQCNMVAEIDLSTGLLLQAAVYGADGTVTFTSDPQCEPECAAYDGEDVFSDAALAVDAPSASDAGSTEDASVDAAKSDASDAGPDVNVVDTGVDTAFDSVPNDSLASADSTGSDASVDVAISADTAISETSSDGSTDTSPDSVNDTDQTTATPQAGPFPYALEWDGTVRELYVSLVNRNAIAVITVDVETGAFKTERRIALHGALAEALTLRVIPTIKLGRFIYAIARDKTVRVISLDRSMECETNLDLALIDETSISLPRAACFPIGDPASPRRVTAKGPGFEFGSRIPKDVTFVTLPKPDTELEEGEVPTATPLYGTFAIVTLSDGEMFVIDIEDRNIVNDKTTKIDRAHLPHRFRNALQGDTTVTVGARVFKISGADKGGVPVFPSEIPGISNYASEVTIRAKGEALPDTWQVAYEPLLLSRATGRLAIKGNALTLADVGADFCRVGVQTYSAERGRVVRYGDIVTLRGCRDDAECATDQLCRKPVSRQSDFGLCLKASDEESLFQRCSAFLQGEREYMVKRAEDRSVTIDALPLDVQPIQLQAKQPTGGCKSNADCENTYYCALEDQVIPVPATNGTANTTERAESDAGVGASASIIKQRQDIHRGECFRPGCNSDNDCLLGRCVRPLDGSAKFCSDVPLPVESGPQCSVDKDCRSQSKNKACTNDDDCDALSECRATSEGASKTCVDRDMVCSKFKGLPNRCVRTNPCFEGLQHYELRAGRSFVVGVDHRMIRDPATTECVADTSRSPLLQNRIPVGLATYPVALGPSCSTVPSPAALPEPNTCMADVSNGYTGCVSKDDAFCVEQRREGRSTVAVFSNPDLWFAMGMSHLATPRVDSTGLIDAQELAYGPRMPDRGLTFDLRVIGGFSELISTYLDPTSGNVLNAEALIALPQRIVQGIDGFLYIVDMGDVAGARGHSGRIIRFADTTLRLDNNFTVD